MTSILSQSTNSDQQQDVNTIITQAYRLLTDNKITQSIEMYNKCIVDHPNCWRAYQNLGVAYIMAKDFEGANTVLKTYVSHVPRDPYGHDSLGVSYSQLNDPLQAIASFVNSINLTPTYYMSYYNLGVVLGKLSLYDYALNVYQHCLNLYPNYINAMNNIADIYKKLDKIDDAIQIFLQVIELDPGYVLGIKNLGNCYFSKKDYFSAMHAYIKALQIDPGNAGILHNLALCLDHFGLYNEAGNCIIKSYELSEQKQSPQILVEPFIAGNLFSKQFNRLNIFIQLCARFKKQVKQKIQQKFYQTYMSALQCFKKALQILPECPQIHHNLYCNKLNFMGYEAKRNNAYYFFGKTQWFQDSPQAQQILHQLRKQKKFMKQITAWRQYTKRLVKFKLLESTQEEKIFYHQQSQAYKLFNNDLFYPKQKFNIKSRKYISRKYNHNLRRLILKRISFIKRYKRFNKQFNKVFKIRGLLSTLTDNSDNNLQNNEPQQNQLPNQTNNE